MSESIADKGAQGAADTAEDGADGNLSSEPSESFFLYNAVNPFPRPYRALIFLIVSAFLVEAFIEYIVVARFALKVETHILMDAGLMILMLSPFYYLFLYLPYRRHHEFHSAAQAQIHYLSRQLINSTEKERKLLSQELHDGFGQVLTAMQFNIEAIRNSCPVEDDKKQICLQQTDKLSELVSDLGDYVRAVSTGLHPHMLDELGLKPTLKGHLEEFSQMYADIAVETDICNIEQRFPPEIELVIFRVCQEALNNIVKHANAKTVSLSLKLKDAHLFLSIIDQGDGFDVHELRTLGAKRKGIGLLGMRERVAALGGRLTLDSAPGKGTSINVKLPTVLRRRKNEIN